MKKYLNRTLVTGVIATVLSCNTNQSPNSITEENHESTIKEKMEVSQNPLRKENARNSLGKMINGKDYTVHILDETHYRVGEWNEANGTITWGSTQTVAASFFFNPSISINTNGMVLLARSNTNMQAIQYVTGTLNTADKSITWRNSGTIFNTTGHLVSVDLNDWNEFVAVAGYVDHTWHVYSGGYISSYDYSLQFGIKDA